MSEVKEKIIEQATELASTIADSLSSGGDLSLDMSHEINSKVEDTDRRLTWPSSPSGLGGFLSLRSRIMRRCLEITLFTGLGIVAIAAFSIVCAWLLATHAIN